MPKEQIHIGRVRSYKPNEASRDIGLESPHYVENCNFVTAASGTFQGLPNVLYYPRDYPEGIHFESTGNAAPLLRKDQYVVPCHIGQDPAIMIWEPDRGYVEHRLMPQTETTFRTSVFRLFFGHKTKMTCASDGEGVYVARPWSEADIDIDPDTREPDKPQLVKRLPYKRLNKKLSGDIHYFDAGLPTVKELGLHMRIGWSRSSSFQRPGIETYDKKFLAPYFDDAGSLDAGVRIFYQISVLYDGYQESPMTPLYLNEGMEVWDADKIEKDKWDDFLMVEEGEDLPANTPPKTAFPLKKVVVGKERNWLDGGGFEELPIGLFIREEIPSLSLRITGFNVYRQTSVASDKLTPQEGAWRLHKTIRIDDEEKGFNNPWENTQPTDGWYAHAQMPDNGTVGVTYEQRTNIPEEAEHMDVRYRLCAEAQGRLFVAGVWTPDGKQEPRMVLRSQPQRFSMFNYLTDFIRTKQPVTAMAYWGGSLWVFERGHCYRVDPDALVIQDEYAGIGAAAQSSVTVTSNYMFVASDQNVWAVDPSGVFMAIGNEIYDIEDIDTEYPDTDEDATFRRSLSLDAASYRNHKKDYPPAVVYDARYDSVLIMYTGPDFIGRGWMWHVGRREWVTALNLFEDIRDRVVYGGCFTDHQGRAHIITTRGIIQMFGEVGAGEGRDGKMNWRYVSPQIHAAQARFTPYSISAQFAEAKPEDGGVGRIIESLLWMGWSKDNEPFKLIDSSNVIQLPGTKIAKYSTKVIPVIGELRGVINPEGPDRFGTEVKISVDSRTWHWERVYSVQVDIRARGGVQVTDLNLVIRRFIPRSRIPNQSGR